jgi:hypothetical protein
MTDIAASPSGTNQRQCWCRDDGRFDAGIRRGDAGASLG